MGFLLLLAKWLLIIALSPLILLANFIDRRIAGRTLLDEEVEEEVTRMKLKDLFNSH